MRACRCPGAVFVDLDRTLIRSASGPVFHAGHGGRRRAPPGRHLPGDSLMYGFYNRFGESVPFIGLARAAAAVMRDRSADATRRAGKRAVEPLVDLVQPWALEVLAAHRAEGRPLVLATTSPVDLVSPLADALGFDAVIATRYAERDGRYTGRLDGALRLGRGQAGGGQPVGGRPRGRPRRASHAYSDSFFDLPLLRPSATPTRSTPIPRLAAVALARRWPLENWDRPPGIPSVLGLEPYHLVRPFFRPEAFPYARFDIQGIDNIPLIGPVLLASNHRSYFDVAAIGMVAARLGRPVRFMAKQEVVRRPRRGPAGPGPGRHPGGAGQRLVGPDAPGRRRPAGRRGGHRAAPGHHPPGRGLLRSRASRAAPAPPDWPRRPARPVIPIGLWGTEQVWPRSSKVPNMTALHHPPRVTVHRRAAGRAGSRGRGGRHRDADGGHRRPAA